MFFILGDDRKGSTWLEEAAFWDYYHTCEDGDKFFFKNLYVCEICGGSIAILNEPYIIAHSKARVSIDDTLKRGESSREAKFDFAISSKTLSGSFYTPKACKIPKIMIPFGGDNDDDYSIDEPQKLLEAVNIAIRTIICHKKYGKPLE